MMPGLKISPDMTNLHPNNPPSLSSFIADKEQQQENYSIHCHIALHHRQTASVPYAIPSPLVLRWQSFQWILHHHQRTAAEGMLLPPNNRLWIWRLLGLGLC